MAPTPAQAKAAKTKQLAGGKAPKAKAARYLKSTEPRLKEPTKSTLLLKGMRCSQAMGAVLQELRAMTAPHARLLTKKNQIAAFEVEGQQSLEFLSTKNDCALFAMASHNKKRPNNLILGRTFDHQLLDLAELGVLRFKSMNDYGGSVPKKRIGSKPLLLFVGDRWQQSSDLRRLQNLLIDFYRGDVVDKLVLGGLDHAMVFTAGDTLIHQRTYFCKLKKDPSASAASAPPVPYLIPSGPDLDFSVRRTQWAEDDLYKASRVQPSALKAKKKKNQSTNLFGETMGRLHLDKQAIDKMQGRKMKALRRAEKQEAEEERAAIEGELAREESDMKQELAATTGL